jgi:hypothetical protein
VRRFVCPNPTCPQAMFCEWLPCVAPHQRWTEAARAPQGALGRLGRGGVGGPSADPPQSLDSSGAASRLTPPQVMGIDVWARRQGQTDATILVEHE